MNKVSLSWTFGSAGGNVKKFDWGDICDLLERIAVNGGVVGMEYADDAARLHSIQVRAQDGNYHLTMGDETDDDWIVRTYFNPASQVKSIEILGDRWDGRTVTMDLEFIVKTFADFFANGWVGGEFIS